MQLVVPGGVWKATSLRIDPGGAGPQWGLVGEAVAPGFDFRDMLIGVEGVLRPLFPEVYEELRPWVKPPPMPP